MHIYLIQLVTFFCLLLPDFFLVNNDKITTGTVTVMVTPRQCIAKQQQSLDRKWKYVAFTHAQ